VHTKQIGPHGITRLARSPVCSSQLLPHQNNSRVEGAVPPRVQCSWLMSLPTQPITQLSPRTTRDESITTRSRLRSATSRPNVACFLEGLTMTPVQRHRYLIESGSHHLKPRRHVWLALRTNSSGLSLVKIVRHQSVQKDDTRTWCRAYELVKHSHPIYPRGALLKAQGGGSRPSMDRPHRGRSTRDVRDDVRLPLLLRTSVRMKEELLSLLSKWWPRSHLYLSGLLAQKFPRPPKNP
jgi:hypothetical protein